MVKMSLKIRDQQVKDIGDLDTKVEIVNHDDKSLSYSGFVLSATDVRKNFFKLIQTASKPGTTITITVEGKPVVVMMSIEEFEGWQETLEIMSDKKLTQGIKDSLHSLKAGKLHSSEEVKKELKL